MNKIILIGNNVHHRNVSVQDQTTAPFQYFLMEELDETIKLTQNVSPGDEIIHVTVDHGFTTDYIIVIMENNRFLQEKISLVDGNDIHVKVPSSYSFTTEAIVIRGSIEAAVDASEATRQFILKFRGFSLPIDLQYMKITMSHAADADDSKFGDQDELALPVYFRKENNEIQGLGDFSSNKEFDEYGADVEYTDKAGGGLYGTKITFDIKKIYGIVVRLDCREGDVLKLYSRSDLSGLTSMAISVMGHYTEGE